MTVQTMLTIRKEELRRRVEALPREVKQWQTRTLNDLDNNLHFSQLQAIGILMDAVVQKQIALLNVLDPNGDTSAFQNSALELVQKIIKSQQVWDFFRDKLDLRYSPIFKDVLWVSDTVTWDCHRPVLDTASLAGILSESQMREPPLTYLTAEFSPATWPRGSQPGELDSSLLPIPVIELPWDHVENIWEFMSLHHEVGHDLEADLKIYGALTASLQKVLEEQHVPPERIQRWLSWKGEIFADLIALQLGGPAFTETLMHLLLLPGPYVTTFNPKDPHPTHYPRILMNAAYIRTLIPGNAVLDQHAQDLSDRWIEIYGNQPQFDDVISDFSHVFLALMDTPLLELKGKTVRELMPYSAADDSRIRQAAPYLRTGQNRPAQLRPRHCISAARIAVTEAAANGTLTNALMNDVNKRTMELVRAGAPGGLRGGSSEQHKKFITSFAEGL